MTLVTAYRLGFWLANHLPCAVAYRIASALAYLQYRWSRGDREAVRRNLTVILGSSAPKLERSVYQVFRHFAMYLVDFFRLGGVDAAYIRRHVTFVGREHLDGALRQGRGVVLVSAHLGNYELGGAVAALCGYPMTAVVLRHQDPAIDALFTRQRESTGVKAIQAGMALRQGFALLKRNEILGILADRDFFNNGIRCEFLGQQISLPKGPALFSIKTGAPIVPCFMIRLPTGDHRLVFESPIVPRPGVDEAEEAQRVTGAVAETLERYIRRYPTQWYLFRDFWDTGPWVIR